MQTFRCLGVLDIYRLSIFLVIRIWRRQHLNCYLFRYWTPRILWMGLDDLSLFLKHFVGYYLWLFSSQSFKIWDGVRDLLNSFILGATTPSDISTAAFLCMIDENTLQAHMAYISPLQRRQEIRFAVVSERWRVLLNEAGERKCTTSGTTHTEEWFAN